MQLGIYGGTLGFYGVENASTAPTAVITTSAYGTIGVTQNASGTDSVGDSLTYAWTLTKPAGSTATLSSTETPNVSYVPDIVGTYTLGLIVTEGGTPSAEVTESSLIGEPGAVVSNAGINQTVNAGQRVQLDGTASTPNVNYNWVQVSGPDVNIAFSDRAYANFDAPVLDSDSTVVLGLTVSSGVAVSTQSTVSISVKKKQGGTLAAGKLVI